MIFSHAARLSSRHRSARVLLACAGLASSAVLLHVTSAHGRRAMTPPKQHGGHVLFLARPNAANVIPRGTSKATATGAFIADPQERSVAWDITYQGLEHGPARTIALYNFGAGRNGDIVQLLCGEGKPCPSGSAANIVGTWSAGSLTQRILGELASGRIYVEITGGDGSREIRAQLEPNGAMVPVKTFVAHLTPVTGDSTKSKGTAVLSEVHFPDGRTSVFYHVTVAGASGRPTAASLVGVASNAGQDPAEFLKNRNARKLQSLPRDGTPTGATLTGHYDARRNQKEKLSGSMLMDQGSRSIGITVMTARYPDGELYGAFRPVQQ